MLEESEEIHSNLEAMIVKLQYLASVYSTEKMSQQVAELGRPPLLPPGAVVWQHTTGV